MWRFSSCQVQGRGHIESNTPCQDKTRVCESNGVYVIALADGAGSARLSQIGAERVVSSVTELLSLRFDEFFAENDGEAVKGRIIDALLSAVNAAAEEHGCAPEEMASTMLAVAVKDDRFIISHIGDGVIGYLDGDVLKVASAPANGEYANETFFVTSHGVAKKMKLFKGTLRQIAGFVIMSDGTEQSLYDKRNNTLSPVVTRLLQRNLIIAEPLMSMSLAQTFQNVIAKRTRDDCSIALMSRACGAVRPVYLMKPEERIELYGIRADDRHAKKRIQRYETILKSLEKPAPCGVISKRIRLKRKYARRYLDRLCEVGLISRRGGFYYL